MKCHCKKEMSRVCDGFTIYNSGDQDNFTIYYCHNCGRLLKQGSGSAGLQDFWEHKLLPKIKFVNRPIYKWCKCKLWKKNCSKLKNVSDMKCCAYCGEILWKKEEIS